MRIGGTLATWILNFGVGNICGIVKKMIVTFSNEASNP